METITVTYVASVEERWRGNWVASCTDGPWTTGKTAMEALGYLIKENEEFFNLKVIRK